MEVMFPTSSDIFIEINAKKVAVVESYQVQSTQDSKYVEAFGQSGPVGTTTGKLRHVIHLSRVYTLGGLDNDSISFYELHHFNLVIVKPDRRVVYADCEWESIKETGEIGSTILEDATIISSKRMEILQ